MPLNAFVPSTSLLSSPEIVFEASYEVTGPEGDDSVKEPTSSIVPGTGPPAKPHV